VLGLRRGDNGALAGELQDVNRAQFTWLRLLAAEHGQIFVPRR
jgi:superfamily I DNA/RNA helicase